MQMGDNIFEQSSSGYFNRIRMQRVSYNKNCTTHDMNKESAGRNLQKSIQKNYRHREDLRVNLPPLRKMLIIDATCGNHIDVQTALDSLPNT